MRSFPLLLLVVIGIYGLSSYIRNGVWVSELRLWGDTGKKTWNKARVFDALGNAYEEGGMYAKAVELYRTSIRLNPRYIEPINNLGYLYPGIK